MAPPRGLRATAPSRGFVPLMPGLYPTHDQRSRRGDGMPGRIRLHEFPLPEPEPGAVVMKLRYSGICGTDKHTFRGESKQYAGTPHERDLTYPLICGHENVGEVAAVGGQVLDSEGRALQVGDRIVPGANVA